MPPEPSAHVFTATPRPVGRVAVLLAGAYAFLAACAALGEDQAETNAVTLPPLEPGVSLELARHRTATLRGVAYELVLEVRDSTRAPGSVTITLERHGGADDLVLDFRGLELGTVRVDGRPAPDAEWREDHVVIPAAHFRGDDHAADASASSAPDGGSRNASRGATRGGADWRRHRIEVDFVAAIAPAGASIIRFDDPADHGARYLYTLLVPSDAQQLFPVFDQPDLKARFRWRITAPAGWRVLTNGVLEDTTALPDGAVQWVFAPTEPISTYLAAFAAGPWTVIERPGHGGTTSSSLYVRRSRAREVDADTLLRINRTALEWLERYFDYPYPFAKMDLLLAPAFPFGGMEHVGAIFYNESRFVFRERPTLAERVGRAATIYHEVAHQWFGDLVTMRWFDDLWLKEGFATFMAAKLQQELHPESGAWKTFYLRTKPPAYAVDATSGTSPVWQELPSLDLAKSNYGPIVYNKAPAVLKQLEFLVGEDRFRAGVQRFLKRYAYGNATWQELLATIGEAADMDLTPFGEHYFLRPGMPVIETEVRVEDGRIRELALVQRPARPLPGDPGGAWPGKVRVRLGYEEGDDVVFDVTFSGHRTVVEQAAGLPAPAVVFPNDGDYGYGLFLPDSASAAWMLDHAAGIDDDLRRAMAWGALWDLVREARLAPELYVERVLAALPAERDEQIAGVILSRALDALERYVPPGEAQERLQRLAERTLLARMDDPSLDYGLRKAALDAFLTTARTPGAIAVLEAFLDGRRTFAGEPLGRPSRWAAVRRLVALDAPGARVRLAAERARDTSPEAQRSAFVAGASIPDAEAKAAYFARYLDDPALNEEWVTASLGAFNDPLHAELTLEYLRPALEKSEWIRDNRRIFFLPSWIAAFVGGQTSGRALAEVDAFLAAHPELPADIRKRILQARDELERTVRIRAR